MIYGRKQLLVTEKTQIYDYIGVPYPEGYISRELTYVFNHQDIDQIYFTGFVNEEEHEFLEVLNKA